MMVSSLLVNLTTQQFVVYDGSEAARNRILRELCQKVRKNSFRTTPYEILYRGADPQLTDVGERFWETTDKVVECPRHLENHVKRHYAEVFLN